MRWFRDHPRITIALIALLVLLIIFYISLLSVGKDNFLGRTLGVAVVEIQKPFTFIGNAISGKVTSFTSADQVESENEELKDRISELEQELSREKLNSSELNELKQLTKAFDSQKTITEYDPVAAEIISYDGSNIFNVFTVNAGSNTGVEVNDAVINDKGLIGRVSSVGTNWCKIVAIIDESNKIGFQLSKNLRFRGVCNGDGDGELEGYLFDADASVKTGDQLVTSGIGGVYPAGLIVGTVSNVEKGQDNPLKNIQVDPAVNFKSIKKVAILTGTKQTVEDNGN